MTPRSALHTTSDARPEPTAATITRQALAEDLPDAARQAWLEDAAACVREHGVIAIKDAIPPAATAAILADFQTRYAVHMKPGQTNLFRNFQPDPLRAQLPMAIDGPVANPQIFAPPAIVALARHMMGQDLIIGEMGVVISHPGAGPQGVHRDSNFLYGDLDIEIGLPPFAMTMLVPLLDVTPSMGPTEFWLGTHMERDRKVTESRTPVSVPLNTGSVTLCDARILHRGGTNVSGPVRPTIYFSFHRPWYQELPGYERKPQVMVTPAMLQRLPEAYRPMFAWALHLNRTDGISEFLYRWTGRVYMRLRNLLGR
jgi:hypothetical protein